MGENRELETLVELCLQRKQSNYADLKAWDETRAKRLELHLKTAEQVIDYIDVSVKQSDKYLNGIEQFLESKADQYVHVIANTETLHKWNSHHPISLLLRHGVKSGSRIDSFSCWQAPDDCGGGPQHNNQQFVGESQREFEQFKHPRTN